MSAVLPAALPPLPPPPAALQIEALRHDLLAQGLAVLTAPAELERLSRDFHDYSPVLTPLLAGRCAQLAASAATLEQVQQVAAACARHGVPLTLRGAGTGNYGQCVPLAGGLVLTLAGLNRLRQVDAASGVFTAEAGCLLADLDQQLAAHGRALRLQPSTARSASLGGYVAGGSSGIGSLRWGFLSDPGNLLALEVVTVEPQPRLLQLQGDRAEPLNHAYGTNGILTALTLASAEAVAWQELVLAIPSWEGALLLVRELLASDLLLNELCLLEGPLALGLPWPHGCPGAGGERPRLLLLAAPAALGRLAELAAGAGAELLWQAPQGQGQGRRLPLRELTWNHTTLHRRALDPGWTYLQLLLPEPEGPAMAALKARWGDDLLWHLEGVRAMAAPRLAAIPLVRWRGAVLLEELIAQACDLGAVLFNPHALTVEEGGLGVVDADQVAAKAAYDPAGLLNPGKLRGWWQRPAAAGGETAGG
ncbi:MAG: FAD-binding oxidoreductase [Prochlorococcaceae cyanobacterium]